MRTCFDHEREADFFRLLFETLKRLVLTVVAAQ